MKACRSTILDPIGNFFDNNIANVEEYKILEKVLQTPSPYRRLLETLCTFASDFNPRLEGRVQVLEDGTPVSLGKLFRRKWNASLCSSFKDSLSHCSHAVSQQVQSTIRKYCVLNRVLEIGSGLNPMVRYLSDFSADEIRQMHLSDLSQDTVLELKTIFPSNKVLQLDLTAISKKIQKPTYTSVVGMNVLDVLITEDLTQACKEIFNVLKPGGVLVHFCPIHAFRSPAIHENISHDRIIFPAINDETNYSGLYIVDKDDFFTSLESKKTVLPKWVIDPLEKYAAMTSAEREALCEALNTGTVLDQVISLSRCFKRLECKTVKTISFETAFEERVRLALESAGFEIVAFGNEQSEVYVNYPWQKYGLNQITMERKKSSAHFIGMLAPDTIQQTVNMLVIVAKKNESCEKLV